MVADMPHDAGVSTPPSSFRRSLSAFALILHALVFALLFNPIPTANATVVQTDASDGADHWRPPIQDATEADILNPFIPPDMPWSSAHRGIDIRAAHEQVLAPEGGKVSFVGMVVDRPVITIKHPNGLMSSFEPVDSDLTVGESVAPGQRIGTLSTETSHCDVQCVHWGVRKPDAWQIGSTVRDLYIDPAFLLGWSKPSILWPVHSDPSG